MHKMIFVNLQQFAGSQKTWNEWLERAHLTESLVYLQGLSDAEAKNLLIVAAGYSNLSMQTFLKNFGRFVAPRLIKQFSHYIDKDWGLLEFLEHTEDYIHKEVRNKIRGANPPTLKASKITEDEVLVHYSSPLKMCAFAEGLIEAAAKDYNEKVSIFQTKCMLKGDSECEIHVKKMSEESRFEGPFV